MTLYTASDVVHVNTDSDFLSSLQEAVLKRLLEGLQTFRVLLKYVEREYPDRITREYILGTNQMINEIRGVSMMCCAFMTVCVLMLVFLLSWLTLNMTTKVDLF